MRNLVKHIRNISRIHKPTMRWDTVYLMEGLPCPGLSLCWLHIQRALPKDPPEPPLSPLLQLETMEDHPYLMSPTTQPFTPHCPITQSPHPTYQNHLTGQRHTPGFTPRSQAWTHRPLHKLGQQQRPHHQTRRGTYLGTRDQHQTGSLWREDRVDFHKATEVIRQVIAFVQSLPHVTNNHRNTKPDEPSQAPWLRHHREVSPHSHSCQNHCHPLVLMCIAHHISIRKPGTQTPNSRLHVPPHGLITKWTAAPHVMHHHRTCGPFPTQLEARIPIPLKIHQKFPIKLRTLRSPSMVLSRILHYSPWPWLSPSVLTGKKSSWEQSI